MNPVGEGRIERVTEPSVETRAVASLRSRAEKLVRKYLSHERAQHCARVAATAREIALRFGADPERAELAGLLHDVAREMTEDELLRVAERSGVHLPHKLDDLSICLHGTVGALVVRDELGVRDEEVLKAISSHVTGRKGWGLLERVVYLADKVEPGRSYPGVEAVRGLLHRGDFEGALKRCLLAAISYCMDTGTPVHPETVVILCELFGQGRV